MDLHGDALDRIVGDMDDMESKKMTGGATITITVSPGTDSSDEGGPEGAGDLPADGMSKGGTVLPQLEAGHDAIACKGLCPVHKDAKKGYEGPKADGITMAAGGQVPAPTVPAEVDDMRLPPFLRKKKAV